ncbi:MAG: UPF0182 family protein [Armatimonadaceae bacterium]
MVNRARLILFFVLLSLIGLLLFFGNRIATVYTDWLWYIELGQTVVFWRIYGTRIFLFFLFGLLTFLLAYLNIYLTERISPPGAVETPDHRALFRPGTEGNPVGRTLQRLTSFRSTLDQLLVGGAVVFGIATGITAQTQWDSFLRFIAPSPFGTTDPVFGRDIGYFVFTLPFLRYLQGWLLSILLLVGVGTAGIYLYQQRVNSATGRVVDQPHVQAHLSALAALALLIQAWGYFLRRFEMVYGSGRFPGATYTDLHARMPISNLLIAVTVLAAVAVLVNVWRRSLALPVIALSLWGVFFVTGMVFPYLLQRLRVLPNEAARETPYIDRALKGTRKAYDLSGISPLNFTPDEVLTETERQQNTPLLSNLRIWGDFALQQIADQSQSFRQYYRFSSLDTDRYWLGDSMKQVAVAVRGISPERFDPRALTWSNLHLRYTHGYGAVVVDTSKIAPSGQPEFLISGVPPASNAPELALSHPQVYYSTEPGADLYAVVNPKNPEFDYPTDGEAVPETAYRYRGSGGVPLTLFNRFAFAARFTTWSLFLSQEIQPDSRILFFRHIRLRVKRIAPFLMLDNNPYPVVANGRVYWVLDGYTTASTYPYSAHVTYSDRLAPVAQINYIRGAVKAVVDSYDGSIRLFGMDDQDPLLRSYRRLFPGLISSANAMPEEIRTHIRYPEDLMTIQSLILSDYHVEDPNNFYLRADSWSLSPSTIELKPVQNVTYEDQDTVPPQYSLCHLPGAARPEFVLLQSFTPKTRGDITAILIARCDGLHYGERYLLRLSPVASRTGLERFSRQVRSEEQVRALINETSQRGNRVRLGLVRILPVQNHLLYSLPVYTLGEPSENAESGSEETGTSAPELRLVALGLGNTVAVGRNLPEALNRLVQKTSQSTPESLDASGEAGALSPQDAAFLREIKNALRQYEEAQSALRNGDWARYGSEIDGLGSSLERLRRRAESATTRQPATNAAPNP